MESVTILIISVFTFAYRRFSVKFKDQLDKLHENCHKDGFDNCYFSTLKSDVLNKDYLSIKILHQPCFLN